MAKGGDFPQKEGYARNGHEKSSWRGSIEDGDRDEEGLKKEGNEEKGSVGQNRRVEVKVAAGECEQKVGSRVHTLAGKGSEMCIFLSIKIR